MKPLTHEAHGCSKEAGLRVTVAWRLREKGMGVVEAEGNVAGGMGRGGKSPAGVWDGD